MESRQPKRVKRKLRGRKIGSDVCWGGALEQRGVKQGISVLRGILVSVWVWYKREKFRPCQECKKVKVSRGRPRWP
jgi:hypothetical protein